MLYRAYDGRYGTVVVRFDGNLRDIVCRTGVVPSSLREVVRHEGDARDPTTRIWSDERKREADERRQQIEFATRNAREARNRQRKVIGPVKDT